MITDAGCASAGLPATYPKDAARATIPHAICQPIGKAAYDDGEPGIACRSAAPGTARTDEELALFSRARKRLRAAERWAFDDWYCGGLVAAGEDEFRGVLALAAVGVGLLVAVGVSA